MLANPRHIRTLTMIASLTTMLFIVLKLFSILKWKWIWITSPLWGVIALSFVATFIDVLFQKKEK